MSERPIIVSAVVLRDERGRVLTVRKRGTTRRMLPGGKWEPGELDIDAAVREAREEIGVQLDGAALRRLGTFTADAANEPGQTVTGSVYLLPGVAPAVEALGEIERLEWIEPDCMDADLAPMLRDHVLPAVREGKHEVRRVTVFAGASAGKSPAFAREAARLGRALAQAGVGIAYGGGGVGLMGAVADAARGAGGEVIGVIPQSLMDREHGHPELERLEVVPDMHVRKRRMAALADAFIALPGGAGTLEELFEAWTWLHLEMQPKPVVLYEVEGFWKPLLDALDSIVEAGLLRPHLRKSLLVVSSPEELFEALAAWEGVESSPI